MIVASSILRRIECYNLETSTNFEVHQPIFNMRDEDKMAAIGFAPEAFFPRDFPEQSTRSFMSQETQPGRKRATQDSWDPVPTGLFPDDFHLQETEFSCFSGVETSITNSITESYMHRSCDSGVRYHFIHGDTMACDPYCPRLRPQDE